MNKKLIAAAVSAAVVAPVAAYGEASFYGRVNNAIDINDLDDSAGADSTTDVSGVASRFGFKYSGDIGNGLTAHGRYEFATTTDKEGPGVNDTRIATVGLSGAFGRVDIGNQWSAYFNTFGTLVSPTYSLGYFIYSSIGQAPYRASNTIKYSNSFGPVSAELDIRFNDDASPESRDVAENLNGDGVGLGLSFAVSDNITIAAAFDSEDGIKDPDPINIAFVGDGTANDGNRATFAATSGTNPKDHDNDRVGIAVKGTFGNFWASLGWQNYEAEDITAVASGSIDLDDDGTISASEMTPPVLIDEDVDIDSTFLFVGGSLGEKTGWLVGYSQADDGVELPSGITGTVDGDAVVETDDSSQLTWGVYHNMGGGLRLYYEAMDVDSENLGYDGARHLLGMRIDF